MKKIIAVAIFLAASPAFAEQQPDPAFLQRAITALQAQRNAALDQAAAHQARADGLADELAKAQAKIKELEPKLDVPAK